MHVKFFDIRKQNALIKGEFLKYVDNILFSGEICMGKLCREFEERWAFMNGARFCSLMSSGTDALTLTIDALDTKGPVVTPALSFIATPNAVSLNRKQVVFCDVMGNDANINSLDVFSKLSTQKHFNPAGAVLAVAMYGSAPDMENLQNICKGYGIPFVLDACQAHLATYKEKNLIDYCDVVVHSFYVTKNLAAFTELGAVVTNDEKLYNKLQSLKNHGRGKNNYEFDEVGYNCRPSEIAAASLLVRLPYIQEWTRRRIEIAKKYDDGLKELKNKGKLNYLEPNDSCVYHLYPCFVENRDEIRKKLLEVGVETQCQYPVPLHLQKAYSSLDQGAFPVAEKLCESVITLPMYDQLSDSEVDYVIECVNKILK